MNKYLSILKISLKQEFAYRINFILWRFRNTIQILVFFFLWDSVFTNESIYFGYSKEAILTYALLLVFVRSLVLSSKSNEMAGQIASGDLSNYLLKPINYFKYWITRDFVNKFLNLGFSVVEITILVLLLRPDVYIQSNFFTLFIFTIFIVIAIFLFFNLLLLTNFVPFWAPETAWGAQFLMIVIIVEFLSGSFFPLDVLPKSVFDILKFTPFPYLVYVPIKIYLGGFNNNFIAFSLIVSLFWSVILWFFVKRVWIKGLKVYEAYGR